MNKKNDETMMFEIPKDTDIKPKEIIFTSACLAGLALGVWPDLAALTAIRKTDQVFTAQMPDQERQSRRREWQQAVRTAIAHGRVDLQ